MPLHDMCSLVVMVGLDLAVTAECPAGGVVTLRSNPDSQNWAAFGDIWRGSHQKGSSKNQE